MNKTKRLVGMIGFVLCGAFPGTSTYGQPAVSVEVRVPLPGVEIRAESDFYEPLAPQGEWIVIGSYGRCWRPRRVEAGWRPYCHGYWQRTDAGWYWASDEPWAWATYHYGRWDLSAEYGWYWVPQTQWAPAWVSWHSGGGYVGWAPLYPSNVRVISPQAYVFVKQDRFLEPVRPTTVVVNNTTIINQTVINEAPATAAIEKASGRKVQAVPVQELRHKDEAAVVTKQKAPAAIAEKQAGSPVSSAVAPGAKTTAVAHAPTQVQKPAAAAAQQPATPAPKHFATRSDTLKPVPVTAQSKSAVKPDAKAESNHPVAAKEPTGQKANQNAKKQAKPAKPVDKNMQQPAQEKPAASEKNEPNTADKNHENKGKE
jgi:hypothetical protein